MLTDLGLVLPAQEPSQESLASVADRLWECKFLVNKTQELRAQCAEDRSETRHILSDLEAQRCAPVVDAWRLSACEHDNLTVPKVRESASDRRCRELYQLTQEGLPIRRVSRWQSRIGPLHIWPFAGRWLNTVTGRRGKLNSVSMKVLIVRELSPNSHSGSPLPKPISPP